MPDEILSSLNSFINFLICTDTVSENSEITRGSRGEESGGAMVLDKPSVLGRPTSLDKSSARAYCACSKCGWGCLDIFSLVCHFSLLSPCLWEMARYRLKYCLKGPLTQKQPTIGNNDFFSFCFSKCMLM